MTIIEAVVQDGRIDVPAPSDLPDGTKVRLTIATPSSEEVQPESPDEDYEEGWDNSPEGIAAWLKWYDSLEPLKITEQEEAEAEAWLRKCSEYELAKWAKHGVDFSQ